MLALARMQHFVVFYFVFVLWLSFCVSKGTASCCTTGNMIKR